MILLATRIAALALAPVRAVGSLLERFSLRALGLAALLAVVLFAPQGLARLGAKAER